MNHDGSLRLDRVPELVSHLKGQGVAGLYVCGSTGEGPLLSSEERKKTAEAYVQAAKGKLRVIVHVGHDSLAEATMLAQHAASIGADAIASLSPGYFKCDSVDTLIDWLGAIAHHAAPLPLYYYHIPSMSGHSYSMTELLEKAPTRLPTLAGIKYTATDLAEFQACVELSNGRYDLYFGVDEMLLSAVAVGASGAVGSTYNFAAHLYLSMVEAYFSGKFEKARRLQAQAVHMVSVLKRYRGMPGIKAAMKLVGLDCGPNRPPLNTLTEEETIAMKHELARWLSMAST